MIVGIGFHYLDIYSDIIVLIDLFSNDMIHFYVCLGIIILSSIFNFVNHIFVASGEESDQLEKGACRNFSLLSFIMGLLQIGILNETYHSIRLGKKTRGYVYSRIFESMIESLPQCLFQLYVFLKNINSFSNYQIFTYSFSILISILSVTFSIVSYEIFISDFSPIYCNRDPFLAYTEKRFPILSENYPQQRELVGRKKMMTLTMRDERDEIHEIIKEEWNDLDSEIREKYQLEVDRIYAASTRKIKLFSPYGILLMIYRFTEVIARIGLIALFSISIGSGWGVCYILTFDCLAILISKKIYYSYYIKESYIKRDCDLCKKCKDWRDFMEIVFTAMNQIMNALNEMGVRWYPFYGDLESIFRIARFENTMQIYRHWYIKFFEGILMAVFIVNSFIINFKNNTYYSFSIFTILCFVIQNVLVKFFFNQKKCSEYLYEPCF